MNLAPSDPDRFLVWMWERGPRSPGTHPLTVSDWWFEVAELDPSVTGADVRGWVVELISRIHQQQQRGNDQCE